MFAPATVDGATRTVLRFAENDGLSLAQTTGVIPNNTYSVVVLFSFTNITGFRRILDFKNGASDNGLYEEQGRLRFYDEAAGSGTTFAANAFVQVVLTRDASRNVVGYVNGVQQFSFADTSDLALIDTNNRLRFFRDNESGGTVGEASAGSVARIRLYDGALTASEVAALDRLPGGPVTPTCVPPPSGMVSWLPGDGNANDIQGTNNGVLQGGATATAAGKVGQAFGFNGTSAFVQVPDSPLWAFGTRDFTIDFWASFSSVRSTNIFLGNDEGPTARNKWIFWLNGGQLQFHINSPTIGGVGTNIGAFTFSAAVNQFYHVAVTRSGNAYTFYVDGNAVSSVTNTQPVPDANAPLTIGQAEGIGFLDGHMDEIEIFNRALTASEIKAIFDAGSAGKCKAPVTAPAIGVTPTSLDFGNVTVGQSADRSLVVSNTGSAPLMVSSITSSNPQFSVTSPSTPFTVAAGGQQAVNVRFIPSAGGSQGGTLSISSNDPGRATVSVAMTGTGVAPGVRTLSVPNSQGSAGSTVNVPINLTDSSNISALRFTLTFDPAILSIPTRTAVTRGSLAPANFSLTVNLATPGQVLVIVAPPLESPVPTLTGGSGTVAVIGFQVAAGAADGASSPLRFALASASDPNANAVQLRTQDGTFTVVRAFLLGDVNIDGQVNEQDLIRLIQHLSAERPLTGAGLQAADTNCDRQVNEQDLIRLIQHLSGERPLPLSCPTNIQPARLRTTVTERVVDFGEAEVDEGGVLVPIRINEGNDVAAAGLLVRFDPELLSVVEVLGGELLPEEFTVHATMIKPGELKLLIAPSVASPVPVFRSGGGVLVKLRLQVFDPESSAPALESLKLEKVILVDSESRVVEMTEPGRVSPARIGWPQVPPVRVGALPTR